MAYTEQITFLLFLKMADEQSKPPYNKKIGVPKGLDWASLLEKKRGRSSSCVPFSAPQLNKLERVHEILDL